MAANKLYYGDNLAVLREHIQDESVDLVYLDPPFKSDQDYNVLFKEQTGERAAAQIKAFEDTWCWDASAAAAYEDVISRSHMSQMNERCARAMEAFRMMIGTSDMLAYLSMMAPRLMELRRVLRSTGSIYLHCDPTASHYLKLLMDAIFGTQMFGSEIIWRRTNAHSKLSRQYGPIHDTILFYGKAPGFHFAPGKAPYSKAYIEKSFNRKDALGPFQANVLTGQGIRHGESGEPWKGYNPSDHGRHWAIPKSLRGFLPQCDEKLSIQEQLDILYDQELIIFPKKKDGQPRYKQRVADGIPYQDIWAYQPGTKGVLFGTSNGIDEDVKWLEDEAEKLGYATQKPEGLLERMLISSSNEGDVVLDPFCGCGTAVATAQKLNRHWIGIDVTHLAVTLIKQRLFDSYRIEQKQDYLVIGEPESLSGARQLATEDKYQFQYWALGLVGARPHEKKKGADRGIDGSLRWLEDERRAISGHLIISVKGGQHVNVSHIRDLVGTIEREKAAIGVYITLVEPTKPMLVEAASAGFYEHAGHKFPRIQILTIKDLLDGKRIQYPYSGHANVTFAKAERATTKGPETAAIEGFEANPFKQKKK